jgi:hypothetical protein
MHMPSFMSAKRARIATCGVAGALLAATAVSAAAATSSAGATASPAKPAQTQARPAGQAQAEAIFQPFKLGSKLYKAGPRASAVKTTRSTAVVKTAAANAVAARNAAAAKAAARKAEAHRAHLIYLRREQVAAQAAAQAAAAAAAAKQAAQEARQAQQSQQAQQGQTPQVAASGNSGSPQQIAASMMGQYGWSSSQFSDCLVPLWTRESGWNPSAVNPSSGAYGIPQALPASQLASAGANWQTSATTQIEWGLKYIQGRYGTPCGAWAHEEADGWY